jgi:manganese/zinc/iron transport system ATP- binding protein
MSKRAAISVQNLTVAYQEKPVLWNLSVTIYQGSLLGIIGPNGAGKTTFIKSLIGLIKPIAGDISFFGKSNKDISLTVAYVPQRSLIDWDFPINAFEVVLMGTYGRLGWFARPGVKEKEAALCALEHVGLREYAQQPIGQLSGGQQQRVFLARALVQDAPIYLLDEPFNGVDNVTEKLIIHILKDLCKQGKTVMVVHHDLQTLAEYFDWLLLLNRTCVAYGMVDQVLKPEYICAAYGERNLFSHVP